MKAFNMPSKLESYKNKYACERRNPSVIPTSPSFSSNKQWTSPLLLYLKLDISLGFLRNSGYLDVRRQLSRSYHAKYEQIHLRPYARPFNRTLVYGNNRPN